VNAQGHGTTEEVLISAADQAREALLMGLRLAEGVSLPYFAARTGMALEEAVEADMLAACIEEGYLTLTPERITATEQGRHRLDALLPALLR
jgi:coproporphyrinogen III oxidase-like Fe-S oxidoreductase